MKGGQTIQENENEPCVFCGIFIPLKVSSTTEFTNTYPDLAKLGQVIEDWQNLALLVDVAPIVQDHLLLITKGHYRSMASIPRDLKKDVGNLIETITQKMKSFFPESEVLIFEHGTGMVENTIVQCGACGKTEHAHFHILPLTKDKKPWAFKLTQQVSEGLNMSVTKVPSPPDVDIDLVTEGQPYLYLWSDLAKDAYVLVQDKKTMAIPSQLLRKLVVTRSTSDGDPSRWLWQDFILFHQQKGRDMIRKTIRRWK